MTSKPDIHTTLINVHFSEPTGIKPRHVEGGSGAHKESNEYIETKR